MERKLYETATFKVLVIAGGFVALCGPIRQWLLASVGW